MKSIKKLWTKNYILIMIINFLAAMANSSFVSTMPIYVNQMGGNNALVGIMSAAQTILSVVFRPFCGYLYDNYGKKKTLIIGSIIYAINTIAYNFSYNLTTLFIVRTLQGIGTAMFTVSAATLVADIVPEERLIDGVGYYSISASLSTAVAPLTATYISMNFSFSLLFIVMSGLVLLGVLLSFLIKLPNEKKHQGKKYIKKTTTQPVGKKSIIEISVIGPSIVMFFISLCLSSGNNFITLYGLEKNIENISIYFFVNGICMIVSKIFTGKLSNKMGYTKSIFLGIFLIFSSYMCLAAANSLHTIVLAGVLCGFGSGIATPIINSLIYIISPKEKRGAAQATYGMFTFIGMGFGAMLWGAISEKINLSMVFLFAGISVIFAALHYFIFVFPKIKQETK